MSVPKDVSALIIIITKKIKMMAVPKFNITILVFARNRPIQEKKDLVKWIYVTISFHPQLNQMSNLTAEDVEMANIRVADYMTNVFAYKCNDELNQAIKYEGEESILYAFELLGELAMGELMQDEGVTAASELFIEYVDLSIFAELFADF